MAVNGGEHMALPGGEDFVALQAGIEMPEYAAQTVGVDTFGDIGEFIGRRQGVAAQPPAPARPPPVLLELVEAAYPADEHGKECRGENFGRYPG